MHLTGERTKKLTIFFKGLIFITGLIINKDCIFSVFPGLSQFFPNYPGFIGCWQPFFPYYILN